MVESPILAWAVCVPLCALLGALTQLLIPRAWPRASLGIAYASLGGAAVFALRGVLEIPATGELHLVYFQAIGYPVNFALSPYRMVWCLLALLLAAAWVALQARGGRSGKDAAMAGCWLGIGVALMTLAGHVLLEAIGLGVALGALWLGGVAGEPATRQTLARSLGMMLLSAAVLLTLLSWCLAPDTALQISRALKLNPGQDVLAFYNVPGALTLLLAARLLAFAVIGLLLWRCKLGLEKGNASRWLAVVLLPLGIALVKPVPVLAYVEVDLALAPLILGGVGLAAGTLALLAAYTATRIHGILGVTAELLNQLPMLLVEFVRMLLLLPVYKMRGGRVKFQAEKRS
ncbi:MAG: hypothetical protein AAGK14_12180 [Verrucomicrobiota bacterium]